MGLPTLLLQWDAPVARNLLRRFFRVKLGP